MRRLSADELGFSQLLLKSSFQPGVGPVKQNSAAERSHHIHSFHLTPPLIKLSVKCYKPRKYQHTRTTAVKTLPFLVVLECLRFPFTALKKINWLKIFAVFLDTTRKCGLFRENMAYLRIVWPYLRKMLLFKDNFPVLEDNMAAFKES
jgi:hypothetical protein